MIIMGIDPGTNCTGVSIIDYSGETPKVIFVETILADKLANKDPATIAIHGSRFARIRAAGDRLESLFFYYNPDAVGSESPYMGRFANSFAALTEMLAEFRTRLYLYDRTMPFYISDPASIKKFLGVKGTSGDKSLMADAVIKKSLLYVEHLNPADLDEHSIDAIAVNLWLADLISKKHYGV